MISYLRDYASMVVIAALCFLCLPQTCLSNRSSFALGSRCNVSPTEQDLDSSITKLITSYSRASLNDVHWWYGDDTTRDNIYTAARGGNGTWSMSFYIGHAGVVYIWGLWDAHYCITEDTQGSYVYDEDIYPHTVCRNLGTRFAFLWACEQGDVIGGWYYYYFTSVPYGMPLCWLHLNASSEVSGDGYAQPDGKEYAFIGFHEDAPLLGESFLSENQSYPYLFQSPYRFLKYFYFATLCLGYYYSVNQALDYAVRLVWGYATYGDSLLYKGFYFWDVPTQSYFHGKMAIYGDGSMHLSQSKPSCVMKTLANGYFYVPSLETNTLRVEMLFNNVSLEGDQTGKASPYPNIAEWPDETVDLRDVSFVGGHYFDREGDLEWDYMADVIPDRVCDLKDYFRVAKHFGKTGNYSSNLAGLTVHFDSGQVVTPDSGGFLSIPSEASGFTVFNGTIPVGAVVSFWLAE